MFWMWVLFSSYCFLYFNTKEKNIGQRKLFWMTSGLVLLNHSLYWCDVFHTPSSSFHGSVLLFFLQGFGLMQLVQIRAWTRYLHLLPFVLFLLYYGWIYYTQMPEIPFTTTLNQEEGLYVGLLSFFYANYGYWCLIQGKFYVTLRRFTAFYIVLLYCTSILFLLAYFYAFSLLEYIHLAFLLLSGSLLMGALVYEISLLLFGKNKRTTGSKIGRLDVFDQRLFGKIALGVSNATAKKADVRGMTTFDQISVTQLPDVEVRLVENTVLQLTDIRTILSKKLIDSRLFLNPTLNLDQLAEVVEVPKSDLMRFFKASTSFTFKQYINRLKVEYAILLIREGEESYTVEELSLLCGFNTRLSFYRAFVNVYGFAPSEILS